MFIGVLVIAATVSASPAPKTEAVHYYPKTEKPVIYEKTETGKVCRQGRKENHKEDRVCLACPEGMRYINPLCYSCPDGARLANIQRKALKENQRIRCIAKERLPDETTWREMPKMPSLTAKPKKGK